MSEQSTPLRGVLDAIGETAQTADRLVDGLSESALREPTVAGTSCHDAIVALLAAGAELGQVAHDVLGHPPGASEPPSAAQAAALSSAELLTKLRFLRAHIVSTVDQQGAAVWETPTKADRPLFAYAVDLQARDRVLLDTLAKAAAAVRS
jgi:hypothetical protein